MIVSEKKKQINESEVWEYLFLHGIQVGFNQRRKNGQVVKYCRFEGFNFVECVEFEQGQSVVEVINEGINRLENFRDRRDREQSREERIENGCWGQEDE
jgi:hypothetical protein